MTNRIGVAAVGDVLDINTWSNIPYFFFEAGKKAGLFSEAWRVDAGRLRTSRILWNARQVLTGKGKGGYQYSDDFIDACEKQIPRDYFSSTVISFNQSFPRATSIKSANGRVFYYIDATLYDLFRERVYNMNIPDRLKAAAIENEKQNYLLADGIVSMGKWSHESLLNFYKIDPSKVFQILPGANLNVPANFKPRSFIPGRELTLGFIGKDWKRKGLPLLVGVRDLLQSKGIEAKVVVIGNAPEELKKRNGVIDSGFINKQTDPGRFIEVVSSCAFGCLFSSSEALGISTLEFLRLGVPVMGYYHQGLKDTLLEGASLRFKLSDSAENIADIIATTVGDPHKMTTLKEQAIQYSSTVTWEQCVKQWAKILT